MKKGIYFFTIISLMIFSSFAQNPDQILKNAQNALDKVIGNSDNQIPKWLLDRAEGILVVPDYNTKSVQNTGVFTMRSNYKWGLPVIAKVQTPGVSMKKGDNLLIVLFMPGVGSINITQGNVTVPGNIILAGPKGNQRESSFNQPLNDREYAYAGKTGNMRGVTLSEIQGSDDSTAMTQLYGSGVNTGKVLTGQVSSAPKSANDYRGTLQNLSPNQNTSTKH